MKIQIIETKEIKNLTLIDANGIDGADDYLGNCGAFTSFDDDTDMPTMSAEDFAWWDAHLESMQEALDARAEAVSMYGLDAVMEVERNYGVDKFELEDNPSRMLAAYASFDQINN